MSKTLKALIMANSKPTRAAFELKKLQTLLFHLIYSMLNLTNWFMCSKQILSERKLWDTLYSEYSVYHTLYRVRTSVSVYTQRVTRERTEWGVLTVGNGFVLCG